MPTEPSAEEHAYDERTWHGLAEAKRGEGMPIDDIRNRMLAELRDTARKQKVYAHQAGDARGLGA